MLQNREYFFLLTYVARMEYHIFVIKKLALKTSNG